VLGSAGCGNDSPSAPPIEQAGPFADGFTRRLVAGKPVADDAAPLLRRELMRFQRTIRGDGLRQVVGSGVLRHDCPPNPIVDAGAVCFRYRLRGTHVVPVAGRTPINARLLLWPSYEDGAWQVIHYDYSVVVS